jgi:hypothetical protein
MEEPSVFASGDKPADANVDYGKRSGYFVRLDVELEFFDGHFYGPGHVGWLGMTAEDAERLGALLIERARVVRQSNADRPPL